MLEPVEHHLVSLHVSVEGFLKGLLDLLQHQILWEDDFLLFEQVIKLPEARSLYLLLDHLIDTVREHFHEPKKLAVKLLLAWYWPQLRKDLCSFLQ